MTALSGWGFVRRRTRSSLRTAGYRALAAWAVGAAMACAGGESAGRASHQLRDSAGVEIVESRRPVWPADGGWRVASAPILRIGVVDGDPAYQFTGVVGAVRLDDGTVVVGDGGSQEVRYFASDGEHLRTVGGPGGGPGEFTGLAGLGRDGSGRVWAYDFSLRRVTWFDRAGELGRITSLGMEPAMLNALGALPGGTFALRQLWGAEQVAVASEPGLRRDPVAFVRFDEGGALVDTLTMVPGREIYLFDENGRGVMGTPPFGRNAVGTLRDGRLVVGSQGSFEVLEISPEGSLLRVSRIGREPVRIGPGQLEEFIQARLESAPGEDHASIRSSLEGMPTPETVPAYGALMGDEGGNLWVGEWAPYPRFPAVWTVLDRAGAWLGEVRVPPRFSPYQIGEDWILGMEQDDLDVEYLAVYPLEKG